MKIISSKSPYNAKRKTTPETDQITPEEAEAMLDDLEFAFLRSRKAELAEKARDAEQTAPAEEAAPAAKPVTRPATQPAPTAKPVTRPATQPAPTAKPVIRPATQPASTAKPAARPATQPAPTAKPVTRPATQPAPTAKPVTRPATQQAPTAKPAARPATQSAPMAKPVTRPATQPASTAKPAARPATQTAPAAMPVTRPATQQVPTAKPAARPTTQTTPTAKPVTRPTTQAASNARSAAHTTAPQRKPTVSSGARPTSRPASGSGQGTMAQSAQRRRAAAELSVREEAAQSAASAAEPRVRAGFVEEADPRPQRRRPAPTKTKRGKRRRKKKTFGRRLARFVVVLAILFGMYLTAVFSNIPFIEHWRTIYIQTAMATMRHQWLATAFIPHSVIDKVMADVAAARDAQIGQNSQWGDSDELADGEHRNPTLKNTKGMTQAEIDFFDTFWEVDVDSMLAYVRKRPEALSDGWDHIDINHSALSDSGTTIRTVQDEQVLAIDAHEGVIIIRQSGTGYRGVMAICKDPSRLSIQPASTLGSVGEVAGVIAEAHNGLIAMTASGFIDEGGVGNGGTIVGYAMCNGMSYGEHLGYGYKRLELRQDNRMYVVDADTNVHPDTTDCMEFSPAMIIDGEIVVDATSGFTDLQPRACMGQSKYGEIIMLLIEGRLPATSLGLGVPECARIMARHECWQAMNLDGGTSAMIWYKGDYIMKSSNPVLDAGRTLPNAFVYAKSQ